MKIKSFFKKKSENIVFQDKELPEENRMEEDDLGISDYFLNDIKHITTGVYQVIWSESNSFDVFDMITIEKITSKGLVIICNNKRKEYSFNNLKTVQVVRYDDYDELLNTNIT